MHILSARLTHTMLYHASQLIDGTGRNCTHLPQLSPSSSIPPSVNKCERKSGSPSGKGEYFTVIQSRPAASVLMKFQCNQWIHLVTNMQCNFFYWHPSSPSHPFSVFSPTEFQPSVNLLSQPLDLSQPLTLPPAPSQTTVVKCLTTGCNSARILSGCAHQCCKHHCKERGGCLSHGNTQQELIVPHSLLPLPASSTHGLPPISEDTAQTPPLSSVAELSPWSPILPAETQPPTTPIATRAPPNH